ncbi:hypothetical protein GCM10010383_36880 [Streptomyces lomondensis]|uniref:Uncharacterized protein n=1 Tax=Streptomyces lomondensis TaxID=68229 RepID=A0ABQ2X7L5_9ACTN|nr:hypothetical protein GCM10010383_36880 [Streptomyces lomondensis]
MALRVLPNNAPGPARLVLARNVVHLDAAAAAFGGKEGGARQQAEYVNDRWRQYLVARDATARDRKVP